MGRGRDCMRCSCAYGALAAAVLVTGGFLFYASRTPDVVLFSHGTPEVPQGRMFTIFNPFRNRESERVAERFIKDLRSDNCPKILRDLGGSDQPDPRVCSVMSGTRVHSLVWRQDGELAQVLVYAILERRARLWISFRRDEVGLVISGVSVVR